MPELPEVEVLSRHLGPLLIGRTIVTIQVNRQRVIAPSSARKFIRQLVGAQFIGLKRRGKYLLFTLRGTDEKTFLLLGHLGMTGRMYLSPSGKS